jgi:hypothetical protein
MSGKRQRTLEAIFSDPIRANIAWNDIVAMFRALGEEINEAEGSRVEIIPDDMRTSSINRTHGKRSARPRCGTSATS